MDLVLVKTKIFGIKNLENEVEITFTKKNFDVNVFSGKYIKAIYGNNGSGKSAIVHAYDFLKLIVLNDYPLKDPIIKQKLLKLINFKTKEFYIENTFAINLDERILRFKHRIALSIDADENIFISKENIDLLNSRLEVSKTLITADNGIINTPYEFPKNEDVSPAFFKNNSILRIYKSVKSNDIVNELHYGIISVLLFAAMLNVSYGSEGDIHNNFDINSLINFVKHNDEFKNYGKLLTVDTLIPKLSGDSCAWVIKRTDESKYKSITKKLLMFLKLLKFDLDDIKVRFSRDHNKTYCYLTFVYCDYSVDFEFESTGIKKLCNLFISLMMCAQGNITIIDEIDAGIHDIFLTKLVEFFAIYSNCQLIFTTHNVGLMESIKEISKSIDILTDDHIIHSWVSDGSYSPSNQFKKGMLDGVPFNLKASDFCQSLKKDD